MKKIITLNNLAEETKAILIKKGSGHSSIKVTPNTYELLRKYENLDPRIKQVLDEFVSVKLKLDTLSILINSLYELKK